MVMMIMMMVVVMMIANNGPHTRAVARVGPSYRLTEATNIITPSHFSALLLRLLLLLLLSQPSPIKHSMWHRVSLFRPSHLYIWSITNYFFYRWPSSRGGPAHWSPRSSRSRRWMSRRRRTSRTRRRLSPPRSFPHSKLALCAWVAQVCSGNDHCMQKHYCGDNRTTFTWPTSLLASNWKCPGTGRSHQVGSDQAALQEQGLRARQRWRDQTLWCHPLLQAGPERERSWKWWWWWWTLMAAMMMIILSRPHSPRSSASPRVSPSPSPRASPARFRASSSFFSSSFLSISSSSNFFSFSNYSLNLYWLWIVVCRKVSSHLTSGQSPSKSLRWDPVTKSPTIMSGI